MEVVKTDCQGLFESLSSGKVSQIVTALNILLEGTSDHEENYALSKDGKCVVVGLVRAFEFSIGYSKVKVSQKKKRKRVTRDVIEICKQTLIDEMISKAWITNNSEFDDDDDEHWRDWTQFCIKKLEPLTSYTLPEWILSEGDIKLLEAIILVARNLSFVAANLRFLAHSVEMLRMLGVCLYFRNSGKNSITENSNNNSGSAAAPSTNDTVCLHAIHTLINIANYLDISGRKLFADIMFVQPIEKGPQRGNGEANSIGMGGIFLAKRFDIFDEDLPETIQLSILNRTRPHVISILSLFPAILNTLDFNQSRAVIVSGLDLLKELIDNTDLQQVFLYTPTTLLNRIIDLLWIPRLGPDSLDYVDPVTNLVSRVTTLKLESGYDATIDFDVRDRALELLERLTSLSPELKESLIENNTPQIFHYLLPICTSKVGRCDISQLAIKVLGNLSLVSPQNPAGLMCIESQIVTLASLDPHIANIAFNSILKN